MEKFSVYSDKTTGISPFVPANIHPTLATYIFHVFLIPIKIVVVLPVVLLYPLFTLTSGLTRVFLDILLAYFFNVCEQELLVDGIRKSDEAGKLANTPSLGDVVFVNANGPLDYFVWKMQCQYPNKIKVGVATDEGVVLVPNASGWFGWCFGGSLQVPKSWKLLNPETIKEITLFVVIEGTISNGKGVLSVPPHFDVEEFLKTIKTAASKVKVLSTKVSPVGISETVIPTNKWYWWFVNFGSISMNLKYRLKLYNLDYKELDIDSIRTALANGGKMKLLSKNMHINTKRDYLVAVAMNNEKKRV